MAIKHAIPVNTWNGKGIKGWVRDQDSVTYAVELLHLRDDYAADAGIAVEGIDKA